MVLWGKGLQDDAPVDLLPSGSWSGRGLVDLRTGVTGPPLGPETGRHDNEVPHC